jgi:hypothetical protein
VLFAGKQLAAIDFGKAYQSGAQLRITDNPAVLSVPTAAIPALTVCWLEPV